MTAHFPDLENAHVFITGGGSGIGAALTEAFLRQNAKVSFVGRSDYADFADAMAEATGQKPLFIQCDVTDTTALHAAMDQAVATQGPLKVQINNAAADTRMDPADVTVEDWDGQIAVNLRHYFFACQKAAALMTNGGSIINFSSASYQIAGGMLASYVASNAGIIGLTRSLARDWGPRGIRVNAISPGLVLTQKQVEEVHTEDSLADFRRRQCIDKNLYPEDVPGTALFLASSLSRMMTAQCLFIDGGLAFTG
ncbi:SDR family NAD(P)-dependent oxidoreductase [Loktanella sp. DJP18]|uniref:SDR family NAD(P)-dependent oxidoreductase n=1 Tax=Loktanella sp. DJP18 TaxID=3409788 RepID=UPI003BB7860F